jgi:hypothetical protein
MTESLTYAQLGERLGVSAQAARALARRLRLPRQKANDEQDAGAGRRG